MQQRPDYTSLSTDHPAKKGWRISPFFRSSCDSPSFGSFGLHRSPAIPDRAHFQAQPDETGGVWGVDGERNRATEEGERKTEPFPLGTRLLFLPVLLHLLPRMKACRNGRVLPVSPRRTASLPLPRSRCSHSASRSEDCIQQDRSDASH